MSPIVYPSILLHPYAVLFRYWLLSALSVSSLSSLFPSPNYIQAAYIIALPYLTAAHVSRVNGLHVAFSCLPRATVDVVSKAPTEYTNYLLRCRRIKPANLHHPNALK